MQTLYFVAMVAGVGWLMLWSIGATPSRLRAPFDMKDEAPPPAGDAEAAIEGRMRSWRERASPAAKHAPGARRRDARPTAGAYRTR